MVYKIFKIYQYIHGIRDVQNISICINIYTVYEIFKIYHYIHGIRDIQGKLIYSRVRDIQDISIYIHGIRDIQGKLIYIQGKRDIQVFQTKVEGTVSFNFYFLV